MEIFTILVLGLTLLFGSVWGGARLFESTPHYHWTETPILLTGVILGSLGLALSLLALSQL